MAAINKIHEPVRNALIKDGWTITAEPYSIAIEDEYLFADMSAERTMEDNCVQMIVVEVKTFGKRSLINALEEALGQYRIYRRYLAATLPDCKVYLALSDKSYDLLEQRPTFRFLMREKEFALIVVDIDKEEVRQWIE
jgi:hypothetical protein